MGVRRDNSVQLTVACAMIGRYLTRVEEYIAEKVKIENLVRELAFAHGFANCNVAVNFADKELEGSVYLTVTGTSAEAGDDGQVGRGNRVNGLITPGRPMSLEAAAGKNSVPMSARFTTSSRGKLRKRWLPTCTKLPRRNA